MRRGGERARSEGKHVRGQSQKWNLQQHARSDCLEAEVINFMLDGENVWLLKYKTDCKTKWKWYYGQLGNFLISLCVCVMMCTNGSPRLVLSVLPWPMSILCLRQWLLLYLKLVGFTRLASQWAVSSLHKHPKPRVTRTRWLFCADSGAPNSDCHICIVGMTCPISVAPIMQFPILWFLMGLRSTITLSS